MRLTQKTPSTSIRFLALFLTLAAPAAAAARVSPPPQTSPTAWVWVQEAWRALTGLGGKDPSLPIPAVDPHRGPGIDPDGSSQASQADPKAS